MALKRPEAMFAGSRSLSSCLLLRNKLCPSTEINHLRKGHPAANIGLAPRTVSLRTPADQELSCSGQRGSDGSGGGVISLTDRWNKRSMGWNAGTGEGDEIWPSRTRTQHLPMIGRSREGARVRERHHGRGKQVNAASSGGTEVPAEIGRTQTPVPVAKVER